MRISRTRAIGIAALSMALALTACGGEDTTDDPSSQAPKNGDGQTEDEESEADDAQALADDWDTDQAVRVTYRYEADFHESDEPATMILARRDGNESLQWEQAGVQAHVNPDADPPFTCTAQGGGDWECYGRRRPSGGLPARTQLPG